MSKININNSNLTFGDNSPITTTAHETDWKRLQEDSLDLLTKLSDLEIQQYKVKGLVRCIYTKDKVGIKEYLRKHSGLLSSNVIVGIITEYLLNFLRSL